MSCYAFSTTAISSERWRHGLAGVKAVIANRTSAKVLETRWTAMARPCTFGTTGLFSKVLVNSPEIETAISPLSATLSGAGCAHRPWVRIPSSDLNRSAARKAFALPDNITLLGSVARLHPLGSRPLPSGFLAIHQDGLTKARQGTAQPQRGNLEKSPGVLDRLPFVWGAVAGWQGFFLRTLDVFVFPSQAESFGLAVVEAAQAGIRRCQ